MVCISTRQNTDERKQTMKPKSITHKLPEIVEDGLGASALVLMLTVFVMIFILLG